MNIQMGKLFNLGNCFIGLEDCVQGHNDNGSSNSTVLLSDYLLILWIYVLIKTKKWNHKLLVELPGVEKYPDFSISASENTECQSSQNQENNYSQEPLEPARNPILSTCVQAWINNSAKKTQEIIAACSWKRPFWKS